MDARRESEPAPMRIARPWNGDPIASSSSRAPSTRPARLVFEAWTKPELFKRWWVPKSMGMTLHSCEMDVRIGGRYRLDFGDGPWTSSAGTSR